MHTEHTIYNAQCTLYKVQNDKTMHTITEPGQWAGLWWAAWTINREHKMYTVHRNSIMLHTIYALHRNSIMHTIYTRTIHSVNTVQRAREPGQCTGLSRWKLWAPPSVYHPVSAPDASIENFCPGWQNNFPGCEVRGPVKTGFRLKNLGWIFFCSLTRKWGRQSV